MVTLSLDTSVLIDLLRRRDANVIKGFSESVLSGRPLIVSAVVFHELESGLIAGRWSERRRVQMATLLAQCSAADFSVDDGRASGRLRADLRDLGTPIGEIDTLIAGQALARGWTVVTSNLKHFGRVDGLPLIDWSVGTDVLSIEAIASRVGAEE